MMNSEELCVELVEYISRISGQEIRADTRLLDEGIIDSFNVLEILSFMEELAGIHIHPSDATFENFASVQLMANWMSSLTSSDTV